MTKIDANLERDFDGLSAVQKASLLDKLQRYVDRGKWAEAMMATLAARAAPGGAAEPVGPAAGSADAAAPGKP